MMLEKNSLIHPNRRKSRRRRNNFEQVDPHSELANAFINQTITSVDGYEDPMPTTDAGEVHIQKSGF